METQVYMLSHILSNVKTLPRYFVQCISLDILSYYIWQILPKKNFFTILV